MHAEPADFHDWPEEAQEIWLHKAEADAKAEAKKPKRTVFYAAPIERIEMATIDALEAVRNWSDQYRLEAPPQGVKVIGRVEAPKNAAWIKAGCCRRKCPRPTGRGANSSLSPNRRHRYG